VFIVPDSWEYDLRYNGIFKKSEVIDGYLIKNNIFCGYIGKEKDLVIPEGVTDVASYWNNEQDYSSYFRYIKYPVESVRFPSTIDRILSENMFSRSAIRSYYGYSYTNDLVYKNYESLKTVYVSENTVIESGAFTHGIEIIRY
jgi:hypothetical protein